MQITGQIQGVTVKRQGTSNGRAWTIYEVTINGQKFDTFDGMYQQMIGQNGTFDYEVSNRVVNGRQYSNNRLTPKKQAAPASPAAQEFKEKMDKMLTNQETIISMLQDLCGLKHDSQPQPGLFDNMPLPEPPPQEEEIDVSGIPF